MTDLMSRIEAAVDALVNSTQLGLTKIAHADRAALLSLVAEDAVKFERGCFVIMELMKVYERRVRSDCTTQEQLDKRPWECAEYVAASNYLRTVWPSVSPAQRRLAVSEEVKRYGIGIGYGNYVTTSDYDALRAELARVKEAGEAMADAAQDDHGPDSATCTLCKALARWREATAQAEPGATGVKL